MRASSRILVIFRALDLPKPCPAAFKYRDSGASSSSAATPALKKILTTARLRVLEREGPKLKRPSTALSSCIDQVGKDRRPRPCDGNHVVRRGRKELPFRTDELLDQPGWAMRRPLAFPWATPLHVQTLYRAM
jgi:hypothetical protein